MSIIPLSVGITAAGTRKEATPLPISPLSVRPPLKEVMASASDAAAEGSSAFRIALQGYDMHGIGTFIDFNYRDVQAVILKTKLKDNERLAILMNADLYFLHQKSNFPGGGNVPMLTNTPDHASGTDTQSDGLQVKFLVKKEELPGTEYYFSTNRSKVMIKGIPCMEQFTKDVGNKTFMRTILNGTSPDSDRYSLVETIVKKDAVKKRCRLEREDEKMHDRVKKAAELLQEAKKSDVAGAKGCIKQVRAELEPYFEEELEPYFEDELEPYFEDDTA